MARFDEGMCVEAFGLLSDVERLEIANLHAEVAFRVRDIAPLLSWVSACAAADGAVSVDDVRAWMSAQVASWIEG